MQAAVGDRLHIHGHTVGDPGKVGEIVEVHGSEGQPPYLVKFDDGHTGLVFPGPDAVIEHPRRGQRRSRTGTGGGRASGGRQGAAPSRRRRTGG